MTTAVQADHLAYLICGWTEAPNGRGAPISSVQFTWNDDTNLVYITFYHHGNPVGTDKMVKADGRKFWDMMIQEKGYTKDS